MYNYTTQRSAVFTEEGIKTLFKVRDKAKELLDVAGSFREQEATAGLSGDSWDILACVDYLVEQGEIRRIYDKCARQHNVYVAN